MLRTYPYIGITGFMSKSEVRTVRDTMPMPSKRALMVGVLASQKTAFLGLKNKWPNRYPEAKDIADIFLCHPLTLNVIHYNTKETETLTEQLIRMIELGGPWLDGFQLNITWPDPRALEQFRKAPHRDIFIILQIGHKAFEAVGNDPLKLAERIANDYLGLIEYVLLDPSGGLGQPFDTLQTRLYLNALREKDVDQFVRFGVAGGLSPSTLNLVEPLAEDFPKLCIDAEGRLRDVNDNLDLNIAKEYVRNALQVFQI